MFRFGLFEADETTSTLQRDGTRVKIQEQPFRLLILLLERPGDLIAREEVRQRLWPDGTYVDFDGSLDVIVKRLRASLGDDPKNPRFIATIPRRGYRFLAPVAVVQTTSGAKVPQATESASGVVDAAPSEGLQGGAPSPSGSANGLRRNLYLYSACVVSLIIVIGASAWHYGISPFRSKPLSPHASSHIRKSVAILGFTNVSGRNEDAWLAIALSEMLSTELAVGDKLRLVSGEEVANLRNSSPWSPMETLDRATTARIGNALNSDVLVLGSYLTIGDSHYRQLRFDVRMQDTRTGEILAEAAEVGTTQDLFRLVSRIGTKLRDSLGVGELRGSDEAAVLASLPLDPEVARFYSLGVAKLRDFDALAAKDLLQHAAEADPKFSLVHSMLARAWAQLGYEQKHRDEAKKALDLSTDLPRAQRLLVEGEFYESLGKQEDAASAYNALFELFPDNVDYGLRLANVYILAGQGSQAKRVVAQLRMLPLPSSDDPRIDLAEDHATRDNKPAALALVRSAMTKASQRGQKLIYAAARKEECMILLYSQHPTDAEPSCEDAYNIFLTAGNRLAAADAVRLMADNVGTEGHYEQAIATYQRALNVLQGVGEHEKTGAILNNMAINFTNEGQLDRAEELYRQARFHFEQAGDKPNIVMTMVNLADIAYLRGNLAAAGKFYQDTLDFIATIDNGDPGYTLYRFADLQLTQGNVKQAHNLAQRAVDAIRPKNGGYQYLSGAMAELGEVLEAEGDLDGARAQFEQVLGIRNKIGALEEAAESEVELATLAIQEQHPEKAEPLVRSALAEFEKEKSDPDSSSAYTVLSRALLQQGKSDEARSAAERGLTLSLTSSDPSLKLPAEIQQARVELATSNDTARSAAALRHLHSAQSAAKRMGYYMLDCEARLTLGEMGIKTNSVSGRKRLSALASEAHSHGLELLAHQAERALSNGSVVAQNH